jgi:toxin ParE1/3/4
MRLIISTRARRNLDAIGFWIAEDDKERAISFVDELEAVCRSLLDHPLAFPVLTVRGQVEVRKRSYRGYKILYRITKTSVRIVAVVHSRRDLNRLV